MGLQLDDILDKEVELDEALREANYRLKSLTTELSESSDIITKKYGKLTPRALSLKAKELEKQLSKALEDLDSNELYQEIL